jgi:integrase
MDSLKRRSSYQFGNLQLEQRKRGPDVWVYRYLKTENKNKSRPKIMVGTIEELPTEKDAQRACEHIRMQVNAECATRVEYTMRGLIDRYINEVLRPSFDVPIGGEQSESAFMSFQCAKSYKSALDLYIGPRWETNSLVSFTQPATRALVERWFRDLLRSTANPKGLAPKTVRSIFNVMKLTFKFGVKWGYLHYNPLSEKRVELPRGSTKRLKKAPQLTPVQFFFLLTLFTSREKLAIAFAGWLGPRISEAFGLRWDDIDFEQSNVNFVRGFVQGRITPLKTEASRTNMPIPPEVLELLREWRATTPFNHGSDWVFASPYTKGRRPFWPAQLLKAHIQPIAIKAGLPKISWHSFRHTVCAWGKEAGLELEEIKALLRHENISTTSQIYGALEVEVKRRIQQKLIGFVTGQAEADGWDSDQRSMASETRQ